jgi:formate hydrogenlyase transcriptional activator
MNDGTMRDEASLRTELEARLHFETLIADLSSKFINLPAEEVDREIEDAQRGVCECLGLDLAALWQWSVATPRYLTMTHLYRPLGGPPPRERMDAQEMFPWCLQQLLAGKVVSVSSMAALPPAAACDQAVWQHYSVKSALVFPLSAGGGQIIGAWGFHTLREERTWSEGIVKRLQLVAQVFTNALARKRSEEMLRESEARLSLAADSAEAGIWELDCNSRVFWATQRARTIFGYASEEVIGMERFEASILPEDLELVRQAIERALNHREAINVEYRIRLGDGGMKWIASRGRPYFKLTGEPERLMGVSADITERKRAEEALRKSHAEIERLKDQLQAESEYLKAEVKLTQSYGEFVGRSAGIRQVLSQVEQVAPTDSSVLIHGETGTGKELVAQAIHRLSPRRTKVMVKVNCAALPSALVESELFGREKGAFTGALMRQIGRFEVADGSTIFLDEIGELSLEVQAKLLGVLQEGQFERLGNPRSIKVNVRVIAATNRDLAEEMRKGRFREDLYYRLNVFPIRVPPLRERAEDIPQLVWAFLKEFSSRVGKKINQVPRRTMEALQRHPWPGNVRELRNVIEHGVIVTTGETLKVPLLEAVVPAAESPQTLADNEREHIVKALERSGWRIKGPKGAAASLGLKPSTLYSRMQKLGIPHRRQKESGAG